MKKSWIIVLLLVLCLLLSSCKVITGVGLLNHHKEYKFLNPQSDISKVALVEVTFNGEWELERTTVKEIKDIDEFLSEIRKLPCSTCWNDPIGVIPEKQAAETVIEVVYKNGEYELINWNGQSKFTHNRGFNFYAGRDIFDEVKFKALIEKYLAS